jgi:thermolysin metallopeptidase-like protein
MALTTPDTWRSFTNVNVPLTAITGSPGINPTPSGAFGRSANATSLNDDMSRNALFITGQQASSGDPGAAARALFSALNVAPDEATERRHCRAAAVTGSRAGTNVVLQQQVQGHDLVGANLKVTFAPSGAFVMTGRPIGDVADRTPAQPASLTPEQAGAAAAAAFNLEPTTVSDTKLEVFPMADGGARWAYRVSLIVEEPTADVRAYVDAVTSDILLSFNIASAAAVPAWARVYPKDPLRTPELRSVRLGDLGQGSELTGGRLVVTPFTPPAVNRPDRNFRMTDVDVGFDEANAYYHLRRALQFFAKLRGRHRFPAPPFRPIKAVVRDKSSPNNAFFRPLNNDLRFGDVGTRPTARSADVLYHEFSHAVSDIAARLGRAVEDSPSRGLSEGYSDYFANSLLDDPVFAEWVSPPNRRDASDPALRFTADFSGPEHLTGSVWAAVLWGIRQRAGAGDTDRLAFESLFLLSPLSTFDDAVQALLSVDATLSADGVTSASHETAIREEWAKRT